MKRSFIISSFLFLFLFNINVNANSAEPPCLTIVVNNATEDVSIQLVFENESFSPLILKSSTKAWESYYRYFYHDLNRPNPYDLKIAKLMVETADQKFEIDLSTQALNTYNNIFTLNIKDKQLISGLYVWRNPILIFLRVFLTLLIEFSILFLFRYKQKRSWVIAILFNLGTQGFLNVVLSGSLELGYGMILYLFIETLIILFETLSYVFLFKEASRFHAFLYGLCANTASLIIGGLLISYLPI